MRVAIILGIVLAAAAARADTRRVAVVAGANSGGPGDAPLRYAEDDASKLADVLTQLGGVEPADLTLLRGPRRAALQQAIAAAGARVAAYRARPDDRTVLVFYYSGHSDGDALLLGDERVAWGELRGWLAATRADVRLAIIDGCRSGAMARKGGARAPAFDVTLRDELDATGEVLLTSSAADEIALESREIRGSFFTHHLVSGLRGAADVSGDGRVSLAEAYDYAFARTVKATAESGMRQHPTYDYRLSGRGDLVLTEVTRPTAVLELPPGFDRALVVNVRRDQVLAELGAQTARRVALSPGEYAVRVWSGGAVHAARVSLAAGDRRALAWGELQRVAAPVVAAKGGHDEPEGLTPEQQLAYDESRLRVGRKVNVTVTADGTTQIDTSYDVYLGRYERQIDEPEFYRRVGRDDLARTVERQRLKRNVLMGAGLGVALVGGAVALGVALSCDDSFDEHGQLPACVDSTTPMVIAVTSGLAGVALFAGGALVDTHPLPPHEMRRLAEQHNDLLRRPRVAPSVGPHGVGLTVGWQF